MSASPAPRPSTAGRDVSGPVPFLRGARAVFDLSLDAMLWSRRTLLIVLILGLPVPLALLFRGFAARLPPRIGAWDFYGPRFAGC